MGLLNITGLSHSFGDNILFKDAELSLNKGEHIGIVGQNGTGKSTLIKICTEQMIPDAGRVVWQRKTTVGYLDQYAKIDFNLTMKEFLKSAFEVLYGIEKKMNALYSRAATGDMAALELAADCQEQLELRNFYSIDTHIEQVASGLGLLSMGLERPIEQMSGGRQAKVILAKLLLEKPDVLLLDEPTNFLDKEHIAWLAEYLSTLGNAFMVVSHDYSFLEKVATRICDIDNKKITKYYGKYSEFQKKKALLREDYIRQYTNQQKEIKKTEEFIQKNIAGRKSKWREAVKSN
jgi:ATPase subunit of ABC transporter with duplicated ATPase domains